jgi:hypothetical protein
MAATNDAHTPAPSTGAKTAELALATTLYHALASGHERLGYNVAGTYALWSRGPGGRGWRPVRGAEAVPRDDWRPCLEVLPDGSTRPRRVNPWVIAEHVRGRYYVAPRAPSWVGWIAFDLDAHVAAEVLRDDSDEVIPLGAVRRALAKRDTALGELWRALALGPGREPVLLETPGQGLHAYLPITRGAVSPLEHTRPAAWVLDWTATVLHRRGLRLEPGRLELYPSGRPLRAPCGARMFVLQATRPDQADDLGLERVAAAITTRRTVRGGDPSVEVVRKPWVQVATFLAQWERARRPLEVWLGEERASWCSVRGPFVLPERVADEVCKKNHYVADGGESQSQDKDEVQGRPGGRSSEIVGQGRGRSDPRSETETDPSPSSPTLVRSPALTLSSTGVLRRGREFRDYVGQLLRSGVLSPGTRHDAVLTLVFHWHVQGRREDEVRAELEAWARAYPHVSRLRGERFVKQCLREGMHYYHRIKKLPQRARSLAATVARTRPLAAADLLVVAKVREDVREEAWAILEYLHGHADRDGVVGDPVMLGRTQLDALTVADRRIRIDGQRCRAEVLAVRELERLGVLALYVDYSRGRHGRVFTCWYRFGAGVLPTPRDEAADALVLAERRVREGVVRVFTDGTRRAPWVELEPAAGVTDSAEAGGAWWRRMYERRRFSVRDLREADEAVVIAGPWTSPPRASGAAAREEPRAQRGNAVTAAPAAPPVVDPRVELAAELGADVEQLADYPADVAAVVAQALRAFGRVGRRHA